MNAIGRDVAVMLMIYCIFTLVVDLPRRARRGHGDCLAGALHVS